MQKEFEVCAQSLHAYKLDFSKDSKGAYKSQAVAVMYALWTSAYALAKKESAEEIDRVLNRG